MRDILIRMLDNMSLMRKLRAEGKLDPRLVFRVRWLLVLAVIFLAIASFDFFDKGLDFLIAVPMFAVGFVIGLTILSRSWVSVHWDQQREMVAARNLDIFGAAILAAYFVFRYLAEDIIDYVLHPRAAQVSGLSFCLAAGLVFGRFVGTMLAIRKVYPENPSV